MMLLLVGRVDADRHDKPLLGYYCCLDGRTMNDRQNFRLSFAPRSRSVVCLDQTGEHSSSSHRQDEKGAKKKSRRLARARGHPVAIFHRDEDTLLLRSR